MVKKPSCGDRALSSRATKLAQESFVNLNLWGIATRMPGFVQTHYLPSDRIIWEINFLLKYKTFPESICRLQREVWGKEILPNFNYSTDVCRGVGGKENCSVVPNLNLVLCYGSVSRAHYLGGNFSQTRALTWSRKS